ncbi:cytochrome P450 [Suillus paluster]|uniref:cytochrome P450 n=1 Tax=Suillus paluster TaxID=48578 RepID=UPI001B872796|nr:cytochrome P450 [Suillus paluster]KAG1726073.1 cytochrome P450 [Suillus paluster]
MILIKVLIITGSSTYQISEADGVRKNFYQAVADLRDYMRGVEGSPENRCHQARARSLEEMFLACRKLSLGNYTRNGLTNGAHSSQMTTSALIYLRLFGRDIVVLNGARVAEDLLEKRSKIYADRPTWPMADLIGRQNNVGFTYCGDKLRASRKLLHASLGAVSRNEWNPMLVEEVCKYVASLVLRFTYGRELTEDYVRLAKEINLDTGMALQPGWVVDSFPFCMHFKRWALAARSRFERCTRELYTATRLAVRQVLIHTAGSVYGGCAIWQTSALLMSFILLMVVFQDIQEKAHAELVAVVGHHRLPTLDDQASLPYIGALIKEIHRFHPVVNLIPHNPMEDDEYEGYRIPRKSWVMCNVW